MPFRWSDSRRPQLQYEGHTKKEPVLVKRRCDACGVESTETEPVLQSGVPIVPGSGPVTGFETPPFVCIDFRGCCDRFLER